MTELYKDAIKQLLIENEKLNKRISVLENKLDKCSFKYLSDNVVEVVISSERDYDLFDFLEKILKR